MRKSTHKAVDTSEAKEIVSPDPDKNNLSSIGEKLINNDADKDLKDVNVDEFTDEEGNEYPLDDILSGITKEDHGSS